MRPFLDDVVRGVAVGSLAFIVMYVPQRREPALNDCRDPGFELAAGPVAGAVHEDQDGYFTVGELTIMVPPKGVAAMRLRELRGRKGTLVFVPEEGK